MLDIRTDKHFGDQRGAIMVLGIMLGAFLVGALFYLVGVGHAVVWREAVQDAADATAYEATVWQARGMNVVVAINIFMAIVMGVLIAWRLALLFVTLLVAVSAIACVASAFVPVLAPACSAAGWAGRLLGRMAPRDPKVQQRIYKVLGVLHVGQSVVSAAGPILSVARSSFENSKRPNVKFAVALGPQLLPAAALDAIAGAAAIGGGSQGLVGEDGADAGDTGGGLRKKGGNNNGNNGGGGNNGGAGGNNGKGGNPNKGQTCNNDRGNGNGKGNKPRKPRKARPLMGQPYSLTAEESDDLDTFCDKASEKMGNVFKILALEAAGVDGAGGAGSEGTFGGLFKFLTKGMSGYFCGELGPGMIDDVVSSQVNDTCANADVSKTYDSKKKKGETAEEACRRELTAQSDKDRDANDPNKKGGGGKKRAKSQGGGGSDLLWADVWGPMANGNMFAQTWSLVRAEKDHSQIDKAIAIAGSFGGGGSEVEDSDDGATVFAQSEVFHDCDADWDSCLPTAAWTLNWRARLRRVHSPLDLAMTGIEKTVSQRFTEIVSQPPIEKVIGGTPLAQFFDDPAGSLIPPALKDPLEQMRGEMADQGGQAAKWVKEQAPERVSIIH